jgi:hypothetical protein
MSRSDIPITCLIRYKTVARLQLSHFCSCPDTTHGVGCLCDCPFCVIVTVITYALVTFHTDRVCTFNMLWALTSRHSRATTWFGELRSPPLPLKASLYSNVVLSPCSRRYRLYKVRSKTYPPTYLSQLLADVSQPPKPMTHSLCVDKVHIGPSWRRGWRTIGRIRIRRVHDSYSNLEYIFLPSDSAASAALHQT